MKRFIAIFSMLATSSIVAFGQYTNVLENGTNQTITTAWDAGSEMIVGDFTPSNTLNIVSGGSLTNVNAYIGKQAGASNNTANVQGSGAEWINTGTLSVGIAGNSNNTVSVFSGGTVVASNLVVDAASDFNLNNDGALVVTGGFDASQVGFNWNDGGALTAQGKLTLDRDIDGTNKTLNVDSGSWDRGGDLQFNGDGNTLNILNGGGVTNVNGFVGTAGSSNNTVMVSGDGSRWINNGDLSVGNSNSNTANSVTVKEDGLVQADSLFVGADDAFNLNSGGTLAMTGDFDWSTHSNLNWNIDGNLSVGGAFSGMTNLSGARVLTLDGAGAAWALPGEDISVLAESKLVITNGAEVTAANFSVDGSEALVKVESDAWLLVGNAADPLDLASGGAIVASTNGANLSVDDGASLTIAETLKVGNTSSETGTVTVANGGTISVGTLEINTDSVFNLNNGGSLAIETGFDASLAQFNWVDGGALSVGGNLTGLNTLTGTNRTLTIDGAGIWDTTATNLYITGEGNTLAITDGGTINSKSAFIGATSNDFNNVVSVGGTGSVWNITEDLVVHSSNTLSLASGGAVVITDDMTVNNASVLGSGLVQFGGSANTLNINGTNSQISAEVQFNGGAGEDTVAVTESQLLVSGTLTNRFVEFETLTLTDSQLMGSGVVDAFGSVNVSGGWIAPAGDLTIDGTFVPDAATLQLTAGADRLYVTNSASFNLSELTADVTISNRASPVAFNEEILIASGGWTGDFSAINFTEHFLLYDFTLSDDGDTVSVESEAAQDGELSGTLAYAGAQGIRAGFNGMQNSVFARTKQLRRNAVATDYAISQDAYLMTSTNAPAGARGPGDKNTIFGMHFWAEQFSGQGDYDADGNSDGFALNNNGTTFALDKLFGDSLVAGINYTYARSDASSTSGDKVDTETYWLALYGEWVTPEEYYLEGLVGLGWSNYDTVRTDTGYAGEGKFSGNDFGGHIEGGKYFHRNNWAWAPYAGLNYLGTKSDAYSETDIQGGTPINVDEQNVASLASALGVKLRNRFDTRVGRFQTSGYAEWAYDFINEDIGSTLSDGNIAVKTARIAPGASLLNAGLGLSWICTDYLEVGVGYDARLNESYEEHTGSIMLDVRF